MKIAPFVHAVARWNEKGCGPKIEHFLVHTGQHYDPGMSQMFFDSLKIPPPDVNLEVGSGTHAEQVGRTMIAFERVVEEWRPDWVVVVGDVNATCACSITAKKQLVPVAHIEAGLRSFDQRMPEEINRVVTDRLADRLFTPDAIADRNLLAEGVPEDRIHRVGNIMIDTMMAMQARAQALDISDIVSGKLLDGLLERREIARLESGFGIVTLHRPSNVDAVNVLEPLIAVLVDEIAAQLPLVWPIHPRTRQRLSAFGLWERVVKSGGIFLVEPLEYCELLRLNMAARVALTDSGGLQEECCVLGTPCLTLRENTERPITLLEHGGVASLVGNDPEAIRDGFRAARTRGRRPFSPPLWDGHTAERIVPVLATC